jgi:hypothetical protein
MVAAVFAEQHRIAAKGTRRWYVDDFSKEERLMVIDYQACLDILRHEDGRKSHLFTIFFFMPIPSPKS